MRAFYFTPLPGLAVSSQIEKAREQGHNDDSPSWTDTAKTFPREREKLFAAFRAGKCDEVWIASLPVLAANRHDMRHVIAALEAVDASIVEGATGKAFPAPFDQGLSFAACWEWWSKRRKLLDDPRDGGRVARIAARGQRMPEAEARTIWLDPTIMSSMAALEKINADPRYKRKWSFSTACHTLGKTSRPPGARPKPANPEHDRGRRANDTR